MITVTESVHLMNLESLDPEKFIATTSNEISYITKIYLFLSPSMKRNQMEFYYNSTWNLTGIPLGILLEFHL